MPNDWAEHAKIGTFDMEWIPVVRFINSVMNIFFFPLQFHHSKHNAERLHIL